jgi:hypothetical protein
MSAGFRRDAGDIGQLNLLFPYFTRELGNLGFNPFHALGEGKDLSLNPFHALGEGGNLPAVLLNQSAVLLNLPAQFTDYLVVSLKPFPHRHCESVDKLMGVLDRGPLKV